MADTGRLPLLRDPLLAVYAFVVLAFALPGRLILEPLGSVGNPAALAALAAAVAYALGRLAPGSLATGLQPVRTAVYLFAAGTVLAYAVGLARPLLSYEASSMDRTLIASVGFIGLALLTADGVRSREHLERLLKLLVLGGTFMAGLGIVQFVTGARPQDYIAVPGLALQDVEINAERSFLTRVMGTAVHPIEYGVVLAVLLPVALHLATTSRTGVRPSRWWWVAVGVITVGIPMSISRSSILGIAVGGAMMAVAWSWRRRWNLLAAGVLLLVAMRLAFPGLLGTLRSAFLFLGEDPSIEGRTQDYPLVWAYFVERPWLGRGLGTFPPEAYFFLDNEYLNRLLTGGVVGVAVLAVLLVVAMSTGRGVYHHGVDPTSRSLGQALAASTAVSAVTWFTFDGLGFRMAAGVAFILMGAAGALWRLEVGRPRWGEQLDRTRPELDLPPRERRPGPITRWLARPDQGDPALDEDRGSAPDLAPDSARSSAPDSAPDVVPTGRGWTP